MRRFIYLLYLLSLGLFLFACSTPMHQMMEKIEMGMGKSEVVEKLGSPNRTTRQEGMDKWFYSYDTDGHSRIDEIHFKDSKVIYIGPSTKDPLKNQIEDSDSYEEYKDNIEKRRQDKSKTENLEDL